MNINVKVYSEWYGCPFSKAESLIAEEKLGIVVKSPEKADVLLITTCTVKTETEKNMFKRIQALSKIGKPLVVYGCLVDIDAARIRKLAPEALLVGTGHLDNIFDVFWKKELLGARRTIKLGKLGAWPTAIIPIAEGCLGNCSFCVTKRARGHLFSYPQELLLGAVKQAVALGYRELWLTAQDTAAYGKDYGTSLSELIGEIAKIRGKFVVRVGMGSPSLQLKQLDEIIDVFQSKKFFKFIHAPVQSGSESIVRKMKRNHSVRDYLRLCTKFRDTFPRGTVWTDIITGYPGESKKDFEKTLDVLRKSEPDKVNVSRFGKRPGTEAENLKDLPEWIKKERSRDAVSLANKIALQRNIFYLGRKVNIFFNETGSGRTENYKQVVGSGQIGEWSALKITGATAGYMIAK